MRVSDFSFDLPEALIARYPKAERSASRLMTLNGNSGAITDGVFTDIVAQLNSGDLLVFNNTRVIPARMFGQKASGGKIEVLVERIVDQNTALAHIRASKSPKIGNELYLGNEGSDVKVKATMVARHGALFELKFTGDESVLSILEKIGHMPLHLTLIDPMKTVIKNVIKLFTTKNLALWPHQRQVYTLMKLY